MTFDRRELMRITMSMAVVSALGALVLGSVFVGTERYAHDAAVRTEQRAIAELLQLDSTATVTEVRQYLTADRSQVLYQALADEHEARQLTFSLDGDLRDNRMVELGTPAERDLIELGRIFVARRDGALAGFVIEGVTRGYKNEIRFLVGLRGDFAVAGVRVVQHEEDPGLGAEVADEAFDGQYIGRTAEEIASLTVTRDPMPEDWRSALASLRRIPIHEWIEKNRALMERESDHPVYAVTGATITSRALTDGIRVTVDHFRHRWALLEPYLGAHTASTAASPALLGSLPPAGTEETP